MPPPTRQEINPYDDLDGRVACEHFLGKSLQQAEAVLRESPLYYQSDFMWMGAVAFRYYLPAVVQFICSDASEGDSDFVAHFAGTLAFRLEHEPEELRAAASHLVRLCDYVVEHWSQFESGADAYGDVRARFVALREAFSQMKSDRQNL